MKTKLEFEWWTDNKKICFTESERDRLNEDALVRINELLPDGYTSGSLVSYIVRGKKEIDINGSWNINSD
jgi:hypothetical protein